MGWLEDGVWRDEWYDTKKTGGRFVRTEAQFRSWVTADGSSGPSGEGGFQAAPGRYHLYVSLACPWAHRTLIVRKLKGLENLIGVTVVDPYMGAEGWTIGEEGQASKPEARSERSERSRVGPALPGPGPADPVLGARRLHQVYTAASPKYTGRVTVPVLWDRQRGTIVSNESSEIIRMFTRAFDALLPAERAALDLSPADRLSEIDEINAFVYDRINNGVYKAGFATTQEAYEEAVTALFEALDEVEARLAKQRWLIGERFTEADIRLVTTLWRFDPVYVGHFKCNLRRIADYPHLSAFMRELYQLPGVRETVSLEHIKRHYYQSHGTINPTGIVPLGPQLDYDAPHDRARLPGDALTERLYALGA